MIISYTIIKRPLGHSLHPMHPHKQVCVNLMIAQNNLRDWQIQIMTHPNRFN